MAIVKGGLAQGLSGKVGSVVFVLRDGKTYIRSLPERAKNSWSPRQQMHRVRFKAVNDYCAKYKHSLIPQIWNLAGVPGRGYHEFLKANMPAFGLDGQLEEVGKLHFSDGKLPLPQNLEAKRSDETPSQVEVSWINESKLPKVNLQDELMMVAGYPDHRTAPIATGVLRSKGNALIDLPDEYETIGGIYLFFAAYKKDAYSPDQYFKL
jgi:hypothetical protein